MIIKAAFRRTTLLPLLIALLAVAVTLAVSGCIVEQEADEEPTLSPTLELTVTAVPLTPTVFPFATPPATPGSEPVTFRGRVMNVEYGCPVDARCSIDVLVDEVLGGSGLREGEIVTVIESYGLSPVRCYSQWDGADVGDEVLVVGEWFQPKWSEYPEFSICPSTDYYVKWLRRPPCGPTSLPTACPTPSPVPTVIRWPTPIYGAWTPTPAP